jgi:hypothetical protein
MKKKTAKQPKSSGITVPLKDLKPRKNPKAGETFAGKGLYYLRHSHTP